MDRTPPAAAGEEASRTGAPAPPRLPSPHALPAPPPHTLRRASRPRPRRPRLPLPRSPRLPLAPSRSPLSPTPLAHQPTVGNSCSLRRDAPRRPRRRRPAGVADGASADGVAAGRAAGDATASACGRSGAGRQLLRAVVGRGAERAVTTPGRSCRRRPGRRGQHPPPCSQASTSLGPVGNSCALSRAEPRSARRRHRAGVPDLSTRGTGGERWGDAQGGEAGVGAQPHQAETGRGGVPGRLLTGVDGPLPLTPRGGRLVLYAAGRDGWAAAS
ncbi:hypothetical protein ABID92_000513 [Frigoribacterium sp. PvP120]|nr:hypothetical protein [Frigoribacterium sp. PvP121]